MQIVETVNEGLKREFTLTIAASDIEARVEGEIVKLAPQIKMPGFRPGKVPANLVRKMHGAQIEAEAVGTAVSEGLQELIAKQQLRPAMQPSVELADGYKHGSDAQVKVSMEVLPVVPEPQIDGLALERLIVEVDDAALDAAVLELATQNKSFDDAPDGHQAQTGDLVVLDFLGKIDGTPFEGGAAQAASIEIGSGRLIPGFEDQMIGLAAGDQKTIEVTFPTDYSVDYLRGKLATFDLTIVDVRVPKTVVADDDFAKSLGLEGIEQLRGLLKGNIEQEHNQLTRTHMKRRLLDQLAKSHDFEVPPSMVDAEFDQIWAQLEHEASHEADPEAARAEMEKDREEYRKIAVRRVRLGLLLSEIGQRAKVEITSAEMNRLVAQAAQDYDPKDRQRFVEYIQNEPMAAAQLRAPLYEDKVVDHLFATAVITDRTVTRSELEASIEADEDQIGHVHGPGCGHDHGEADAAETIADAPAATPKKAKTKAKAAPAEPDAPAADPVEPSSDEAPAPKKAARKPKAAKAED